MRLFAGSPPKLSYLVAKPHWILTLLVISASLFVSSCSFLPTETHTPSSNPTPTTHSNVSVKISPANPQTSSGGTIQFTATVSGTSNVAVTWSATGGTISSTGLFTASKSNPATVVATSVANPAANASTTVTLAALSKLVISSSSVPPAESGAPYQASVTASGGVPPYTWSISAGSLPQGLSFASSGVITGTPVRVGNFPFTVTVADSGSHSASMQLSSQVTAAKSLSYTGYDGPAQLPLVYLQTTMADTPAPGSTITVNAGGNLQSALNNATCGDTILLQSGAVFYGLFTVPAKACDDQHWIIVRTSAPDSALPAEGTRINPCYAGVASLPDRPAFTCPTVKNVMAKISFNGIGISGPLVFLQGSNHYRFVGLEITRALPKAHIWNLMAPDTSVENFSADHFVFDRLWVHGTATDETKGGIHLSGITNAAIVDSYFSDFHCIAGHGSCTDSQAINGGLGNTPAGPYKIDNNFLESSGESILFGGGPATTTPTDMEIRFNHLYKAPFWQPGAPGFVGGYTGDPFVVKNNFELKNAQRVLFEGNILEYSWGGFTQDGFSIVLTPINQHGHCPKCQVTDITVRYNHISNVGGGFGIGNSQGSTQGYGWAAAGERYSIHDVLVDKVSKSQYAGYGLFAIMLSSSVNETLNNVSMQHNTAFPDPTAHVFAIVDEVNTMPGFVFANNLIVTPPFPMWSGGGGSVNCAASNVPVTILQTCFPGYVFTGNLFVGDLSRYSTSQWPSGQLFTSSTSNVGFANYSGGNYALASSSPYSNKGTDGRNVGADIAGLTTMLAGVP